MANLKVYFGLGILIFFSNFALATDVCSTKPSGPLDSLKKIFSEFIYTSTGFTYKDLNFIVKNPALVSDVQKKYRLAESLSASFCAPDFATSSNATEHHDFSLENNEQDAIRHFVAATLFNYYYPNQAVEVLFGHEISKPFNKSVVKIFQ